MGSSCECLCVSVDLALTEAQARGTVPSMTVSTIDLRTDPLTGAKTYIVHKRQGRPNLPREGCPFCVGGLEAPDPYDVRWFSNRWPALPDGRAEVVLYSPQHDATFWGLGVGGVAKVIDLWAERTAALGARPDVDYVLIFENRGDEIGATIHHPHGQIYAFDHVPSLPAKQIENGTQLDRPTDGERLVSCIGSFRSWVPVAPAYPYALRIASDDAPRSLVALDAHQRRDLAAIIVDSLERFDRLFDARTPYMLWIHQEPTDGRTDRPVTQLTIDIVTPWRSAGVMRFVAAGELGSGEFFNTVIPEVAADQLRKALD